MCWWHGITTIHGLFAHDYSLTTIHGLPQLITEPTHIRTNNCSCIDLIFINRTSLFVKSGSFSSVKRVKNTTLPFDIRSFRVEEPLAREDYVSCHTKVTFVEINMVISQFDWQGSFSN